MWIFINKKFKRWFKDSAWEKVHHDVRKHLLLQNSARGLYGFSGATLPPPSSTILNINVLKTLTSQIFYVPVHILQTRLIWHPRHTGTKTLPGLQWALPLIKALLEGNLEYSRTWICQCVTPPLNQHSISSDSPTPPQQCTNSYAKRRSISLR